MTALRAPSVAVATARGYITSGKATVPGMCDHYVAVYFGLPASGYVTAAAHWNAIPARYRHGTGLAPAGALEFWLQHSRLGAGHVALSLGGGRIASTDYPRTGRVGDVPVGAIATGWGLEYMGWTDVFYAQGVEVVSPPHHVPVPPASSSEVRVFLFETTLAGHPAAWFLSDGVAVYRRVTPGERAGYIAAGVKTVPVPANLANMADKSVW